MLYNIFKRMLNNIYGTDAISSACYILPEMKPLLKCFIRPWCRWQTIPAGYSETPTS